MKNRQATSKYLYLYFMASTLFISTQLQANGLSCTSLFKVDSLSHSVIGLQASARRPSLDELNFAIVQIFRFDTNQIDDSSPRHNPMTRTQILDIINSSLNHPSFDINEHDQGGHTILQNFLLSYRDVSQSAPLSKEEVYSIFHQMIENPSLSRNKVNGDGVKELFNTFYNNQVPLNMLEKVLQTFDIDSNIKNYRGNTILHEAVSRPEYSLVRYINGDLFNSKINLLLEYFPHLINMRNQAGQTPIMAAVQNRSRAGYRMLLQKKNIDFSAKNEDGNTVLMLAVFAGEDYVDQIITRLNESEVNAQNRKGQTALILSMSAVPGFQNFESLDGNMNHLLKSPYHNLRLVDISGRSVWDYSDMMQKSYDKEYRDQTSSALIFGGSLPYGSKRRISETTNLLNNYADRYGGHVNPFKYVKKLFTKITQSESINDDQSYLNYWNRPVNTEPNWLNEPWVKAIEERNKDNPYLD